MGSRIKNINSSGRKDPTEVTCYRCKKQVDQRSTLLCTLCKNYFEFDCAGYPEKVYRLKNLEERKKFKWECKVCTQKAKEQIQSSSVLSNVTMRKKNRSSPKPHLDVTPNASEDTTPRSTPIRTTSVLYDSHILTMDHTYDESSDIADNTLSRSLDYTVTDPIHTQELKDSIELLQTQLYSSQNELENVILENNELRKQNDKLLKDNDTLKKFLGQTPHREYDRPEDTKNTSSYSSIHQDLQAFYTPPRNLVTTKNCNARTLLSGNILSLQKDITDLEYQLQQAGNEILNLKDQILKLQKILDSKDDYRMGETTPKDTQKLAPTNKIFIFGAQQCVGLSSVLMRSRQDTPYVKYAITSLTKPYALTSDVIRNCQNIPLSPSDKLVLCVGENDYDTKILSSQLRQLLDVFSNNNVIILSVLKNVYLNVNDLNQTIRNICNEYKNCNFIDSNHKLYNTCKLINHTIDYDDYEKKYLNVKELKKLILRKQPNSTKTDNKDKKDPKGTIPYYFARKQPECDPINKAELTKNTSPKIGTIPHYFKVVDRKQLFREKQ